MKTKLFYITIIIAIIGVSCSDLSPATEGSRNSSALQTGARQTQSANVFTAHDLFPDGDAEQFIIYPRSGWILMPGDVIVFRALLLDPNTGIYQDVTYDQLCSFESSFGGNGVNGSSPMLTNGDVITIRAVWSGKTAYGAYSVGTFVDDREP